MVTETARSFNTSTREMTTSQWLDWFRGVWHQSEHVAIQGPTGTGKSRIAQSILDLRQYVCVLAIKRKDETLERFKQGTQYGHDRYRVITEWPPDYKYHKVVFWKKPKSLDPKDLKVQAQAVYQALSQMYVAGGWCIYLDETGYIASTLGLSHALGVLLNQGRSAYISVVMAMTRPSSVVARVPKEAFTQVRHHIVFKYTDEREIKVVADIVGINYRILQSYQQQLKYYPHKSGKYSDFLYVGDGECIIVRNESKE